MNVPVPGGDLYVEEEGEGDALLLIQGLGNSSWPARFHRGELAQRWRVIAFDNRGTGRSFKPPPPYSIAQHADDAAAVLDALGIDRAHVLGHSMGGYIAQELALRHPERVRSIVLVATFAAGAGGPWVPQETLSVWLAHAHLPPDEFARATMYLSFAPGWTDEHPEEFARFQEARLEYPTPPQCWHAQFKSATRWKEEEHPIEEFEAPVLVVHGDADRVVPLEAGRRLASRIPGAELAVVAGAGHYVMLEQPHRFNELVGGFLARVESSVPA